MIKALLSDLHYPPRVEIVTVLAAHGNGQFSIQLQSGRYSSCSRDQIAHAWRDGNSSQTQCKSNPQNHQHPSR